MSCRASIWLCLPCYLQFIFSLSNTFGEEYFLVGWIRTSLWLSTFAEYPSFFLIIYTFDTFINILSWVSSVGQGLTLKLFSLWWLSYICYKILWWPQCAFYARNLLYACVSIYLSILPFIHLSVHLSTVHVLLYLFLIHLLSIFNSININSFSHYIQIL